MINCPNCNKKYIAEYGDNYETVCTCMGCGHNFLIKKY